MPREDILGIAPELWLLIASMALLVAAPFTRGRREDATTWGAIASLIVALVLTAPQFGAPPQRIFGDTYALDPLALFVKLFIIGAALLVLLATRDRFRGATHAVTVPPLILMSSLGAMALAASVDLVLIALFLQVTAVASYGLVGAYKHDPAAQEATLKYFLFAGATGAVMLYGMALLYGLTGTLDTAAMAERLRGADGAAVLVAGALIFTGFGFKITAVPLHWWAPDAYEGATAPISGFLSVVPKVAALTVLVRTLFTAFAAVPEWPLLLALAAALTMTLGNLFALRQRSVKRLLGYSTIAQAGYLLIAVAVIRIDALAIPAFVFYLLAYLAMNLPAFLVVSLVERATGDDHIERFNGLGTTSPRLAAAMTILLLSLAGIPPLAGFVGKVALFIAAMSGGFTWLVVIAAINTAISIYYYLRVIAAMYFERPADGTADVLPQSASSAIGVLVGTAATLVIGIFPLAFFTFSIASAAIAAP